VVIDAALLLEWGLESACDVVIAVTAPEAVQVERLAAARGWSEEEARRRLSAQRSNEDFAAAADITLQNTGPKTAALEAMARDTADQLEAMRAFRDRPAGRPRE
jgi:dephospho-CoA kinase